MENTNLSSQKLSSKERVKSKKTIEALFASKSQQFEYPFKIYCQYSNDFLSNPQVLVSVPKRNFKKAVDRNRLKRQIREIYRRNKISLKPPLPSAIAIVLICKEKIEFELLQKKLILILSRLKKTV